MQIKVITFNIHHATNMFNEPSLKMILRLLEICQADIINLQEVDYLRPNTGNQNQAFILANHLGMRYVYGPVKIYARGSYGNAILSRYPILEHTNIILETKDVRCALKTDILINDQTITIFNTHLGLSQPKRYEQLKEIILPDILNLKNPALLAGDFNAPTDRPEIKMLKTYLTDTFIKNSGVIDYTFPAHQPKARIDYIFVNHYISPIDYYIMDTDTSDHLPVITKLEIL